MTGRAEDVDEPAEGSKRGPQRMLRAVNRDLRALPIELRTCALAELAKELARRFDRGDDRAAAQLRGALADLRREARVVAARPREAPPAAPPAGDPVAGEHDQHEGGDAANGGSTLTALRSQRTARRGAARGPAPADLDSPAEGA